jgi:hypothetical protein
MGGLVEVKWALSIDCLIALPLDVWDILVAEQPSPEEWHIAIRSWVVCRLIVYRLIEFEGCNQAPLLSQYFCHFPIQLLLHPFFESEMQHWLSVVSSSMANFSSVYPTADLTMINKHRKFHSFRHDISPAIWVTSSNTGLASYLAPITWVTTCATVSQGSSLEVFTYEYSGPRWFEPQTLGSVGGCATNSATPPPLSID